MKTLLLMRHAKSSWGSSDVPDHDRPLNDRGIRDAPRMGEWLRENAPPEHVLSSTALRARSTAYLIAEKFEPPLQIELDAELYLATTSALATIVSQTPDSKRSLLVIAHNPGMESWVARLSGEERHFPTAALAVIELDLERWADLNERTAGRLTNFIRPKGLEDD